MKFRKTRTKHHHLPEFTKFLAGLEKSPLIRGMVPGRIDRKNSGSSALRFRVTVPTASGWRCVMAKGSSAQELFVICAEEEKDLVKDFLEKSRAAFRG